MNFIFYLEQRQHARCRNRKGENIGEDVRFRMEDAKYQQQQHYECSTTL